MEGMGNGNESGCIWDIHIKFITLRAWDLSFGPGL